jgi:cell wall-associated NlpC family hydrolase
MGADWIIQYGKRFIGSHYLWGSAGATPNAHDGAWYRTGSVGMERPLSFDPAHPSIFAATCDVDDHFVCAGAYKKMFGGGYGYATDKELTDYLDKISKLPSGDWPPYAGGLTPRVVQGKNVDPDKNRIVWGEDCRNVRHFDCIGFVNFVLSLTTKERWSFSIPQYAAGNITPATAVAITDPPADGDIIVINPSHIGFLCADGKVLQAQDHANGVHADEAYKAQPGVAGTWNGRLRVPAGMINQTGVTTWGNGGSDPLTW